MKRMAKYVLLTVLIFLLLAGFMHLMLNRVRRMDAGRQEPVVREEDEQPQTDVPKETESSRIDTVEVPEAFFNELLEDPRSGEEFQVLEDSWTYESWSYEEGLLACFEVEVPFEEALAILPHLQMEEKEYGGYRNEAGSTVYDCNTVCFSSEDKAERLLIGLAYAGRLTTSLNFGEETVAFTPINGRSLALFHYRSKAGEDIYYTEFQQGYAAWSLTAENLSEQDFVRALTVLVPKQEERKETPEFWGTVSDLGEDRMLVKTVSGFHGSMLLYLPEGEADRYSVGDYIHVTYEGEPAIVGGILPQQLVSVEIEITGEEIARNKEIEEAYYEKYYASFSYDDLVAGMQERSVYQEACSYYSEVIGLLEQTLGYTDIGYVIAPVFVTDMRYFSAEEFADYPPLLLHIAKNEIYARHGYIFKDADLYNYFMSCFWYSPTCDSESFDVSVFNEYESANLALLSELDTYGELKQEK